MIDSGYRGEIKIRMGRFSTDEDLLSYSVGDKIAQLIILKTPSLRVVEVEELGVSERGLAGFGSSGR